MAAALDFYFLSLFLKHSCCEINIISYDVVIYNIYMLHSLITILYLFKF